MPTTTALDIETLHQWRQGCFYPKADLPLPDMVLRGQQADTLPDESLIAQTCAYVLREPVVVETWASGTFHRLWRVQRIDGDPLVFRANVLNGWFRDYPLAMDAAVAERLEQEQLPALKVHHVDWNRKRFPADFAILDEAPGFSLRAIDSDEGQLMPLLRKLGAFLARAHRIRVNGFGLFDVRALAPAGSLQRKQGTDTGTLACAAGSLCGGHRTWDDFLWLHLERHVRTCVTIGAITDEEGRKIVSYCKDCTGLFSEPSSLLHGDPGSHNVFTKEGEISALIDWEDALAGDPVFEIAFWATFHPERRHATFIEGYREVSVLPPDFELRFWLYFMRVSLAKTVLRHRLGLFDLPGREPAALRIRKAYAKLTSTIRSGQGYNRYV